MKLNPYVAIYIGIMAISFGSIFAKMSTAPSLIIASYRLVFAALLMTPFMFFKGWNEFKRIKGKLLAWTLLSGIFLALHFATWISSLKYISVSSSVVLVALQPVFVALGSKVILKEKLPGKALLTGAVALVGTFIIGLGDLRLGGEALGGDFLAIAGAFFAALYWMVGRYARRELSVSVYTYLVYSICAILLFTFSAWQKLPLFAYPAREWLLFLGAALVPTFGGHSLFNWALGYVPSFVVSVAILGEAIGATILAFFLLSEIPSSTQLIGGALILTGLYFFLKEMAKNPANT